MRKNLDTQVIVSIEKEEDVFEKVFEGSFGDFIRDQLEQEPTRENFFDIMELNWSFLETEEDYVTVRDDLGNNWKIEVKVEE